MDTDKDAEGTGGATGAAAAAIAGGLAESPVTVVTPAGPLILRTENRHFYLTGPAEYIADGTFHYGKIVGND